MLIMSLREISLFPAVTAYFPWSFYIHGYIIYKLFFCQVFYHGRDWFRIRIKLYLVARSFIIALKAGRFAYKVGSPPVMHTPSRMPLLFQDMTGPPQAI